MRGNTKLSMSGEELKKFPKDAYTKKVYSCIKFLEQNTLLENTVKRFQQNFPIEVTAPEILNVLSNFRNKGLVKSTFGWGFDNLLPLKERRKAAFFIAKFIVQHGIASSMRSQLESIFYCGFVDQQINNLEKALSIDIPDEIESYSNFKFRSPITINLNSAKLTKKEVKAFLDEKWPQIKAYFNNTPALMDVEINDKELAILQAKKQNKKYKEILEMLAPADEDISREEYDASSVENLVEIAYRSRKRIKNMCKQKSITKK